jgi:hypothetical protein
MLIGAALLEHSGSAESILINLLPRLSSSGHDPVPACISSVSTSSRSHNVMGDDIVTTSHNFSAMEGSHLLASGKAALFE